MNNASKFKKLADPSWLAGYRAGSILDALYVVPPHIEDHALFGEGFIVGRRLAVRVREQRQPSKIRGAREGVQHSIE